MVENSSLPTAGKPSPEGPDRPRGGALIRFLTPDFSALRSLGRKIFVLVVFALFPILVLETTIRQVENLELENLLQKDRQRHENLLTRLREADDDPAMLRRILVGLFEEVRKTPYPKRRLRVVNRLRKAFPGVMDVYYFDAAGRVVSELSSSRHYKGFVERTFQVLLDLKSGKPVDKGREGILLSFLNISELPRATTAQGNLIALARRDQDGFFVWGQAPEHGGPFSGWMALLHPGRFIPDRALMNSLAILNRRLRGTRVGSFETTMSGLDFHPTSWNKDPELGRSILSAMGAYGKVFINPRFHGTYKFRQNYGYLFAISRRRSFLPRWVARGTDLICILWGLVIGFNVFRGRDLGIRIRIPVRLVGLFLFAIGTPSVVLLVGGYYALKDHGNVLRADLESRIKDKLRHFDELMPGEVKRIQKVFNEAIVRARKLDTIASQAELFQTLRSETTIQYVFVVDRAGKPAFDWIDSPDPSLRRRTNQFILPLGKELLRRMNKSLRVDQGTFMVQATEGVLSTLIGENSSFDLDLICRELGQFVLLSLGAESTYLYFDVLYNKAGEAQYAFMSALHRGRLQRAYIQKHQAELGRQPDLPLRVSAVGELRFLGEEIPFPTDKAKVKGIAGDVLTSKSAVRVVIASGTEEEIWYGTKGQNIDCFVMVAAVSLESVKKQVNFLWMVLVGVALMVFLSTSTIGVMLSEQFLKPIENLSGGIRAIEERRFDYTIPVIARDELGDLSGLMNNVIEGMRDLQVARIVQESLFPPEPLTVGEFQIWGKSRAMTDIGGDYFDYFVTPAGKLMGLVGDVSGHGISAALIMGMAKCAMTIDNNTRGSLPDTLASFNRFMIATIKKKKMMTLFLYSIDPETGEMEFSNAGHNFPLVLRARSQAVDELRMEALPLGIRIKAQYHSLKTVIEPGDKILFFTDGLVEAIGANGEMLGNENAVNWFRETRGLDPRTAIDQLFSRFDAATQGRPASDDVSLICLQRMKGQKP